MRRSPHSFNIASMGCRRVLLALLGLALLGGCGGGAVTPIAGGSCITNKDCLAEEICIGGTCTAGAGPACQDETDCAANEYCERASGECKVEETVGCTMDAACPAHQRCNNTTRVCIDGARPCTAEAECSSIGQHCNVMAGLCKECVSTMQCPSNRVCDPTGICVMSTGPGACTADFSCMPPATICETGACVAGCTATSCAMGNTCNTSTGRCAPTPTTCATDPECGPPTRVCEATQCVPGCTEPGGIQCTGGNVCEATTGRCRPAMASCANDGQCGAPARVCEASQCVPGCSQPGGLACTGNNVCDSNTGRCVVVMGPCTMDTQCGPPNSVCEMGQCIPGCSQIGGIQCTGLTQCDAGSGRCVGQMPMGCTTDASCGPPASICTNMMCVPGCSQTGCPSGQQCDSGTGRCGNVTMPGTGLPLDSACTAPTDCASRVCFDFAGTIGQRCVSSCGSSADCPVGFTCFDNFGAHICLSGALFGGASFSTPSGQACTGPDQCRSGFCDAQTQRCREQCTEDNQCGIQSCQWQEYTPDIFGGLCGPRNGGLPGSPCGDRTDCASGVCFQNTCDALCSSTADCANGSTCSLFNDSVCTLGFVNCFAWEPNFVKACAPGIHGQAPVGATCTAYSDCRSGLCHTGLTQCTDTCAVDADCPGTHRCKVLLYGALSDGTDVYLNVCLPEAS